MARYFWQTIAGTAFTAGLLVMAPALAQAQQQVDWCTGKSGATLEQQVSGCTALIESGNYTGKNLAIVFYDRGIAYYAKKDYESAIADHTEAIRLNPNYAFAFNNRGNAYYAKKDYARASPDYTEASHRDPTYPHNNNNHAHANDR